MTLSQSVDATPGQGAMAKAVARPAFIWRHIVGFEETNLVGNVYFARFASWQGKCREMFLEAHARDIREALARDLKLVTVSLSIDYALELFAFDQLELHMRLAGLAGHRIDMDFEYLVLRGGRLEVAAHGRQQVACLIGERPTPVPPSLEAALRRFA